MPSSHNRRARQERKSLGPWLLGLLIIGGVAVIAVLFYLSFSSMMGGAASAPQTAQQVASATPGSQANVAVEVTGLSSQTMLEGNLLQKNADGTYSRTGKTITVQWNHSQIVMGSSSDVKVGAILQASGIIGTSDVLTATQIVILTGAVQIE